MHGGHERVMHGGVRATLTEPRTRFWIVHGRQFVWKLLCDAEDLNEHHIWHLLHHPFQSSE